jgi:hypothetical protein
MKLMYWKYVLATAKMIVLMIRRWHTFQVEEDLPRSEVFENFAHVCFSTLHDLEMTMTSHSYLVCFVKQSQFVIYWGFD